MAAVPKAAVVVIAATAVTLAAAYAYAAGWSDPGRLTPKKIVLGFQDNFGVHEGYRRNHANGVCVTGYFEGNGVASRYSTAAVFAPVRTPVIGRFAVPGGNPSIQDASSPVRSLALQFSLPNGEQWRTGMNSTPVFAVNTPQAFYANLQAARPDPATGKPDPARLKAFFDGHPETAPFRAWVKAHAPSSSFINTKFYSINAFWLVDAAGHRQAARWALQPEAEYLPLKEGAQAAPNPLQDELVQQLAQGPAHWRLLLQLAAPLDPVDDATRAWPESRQLIDAGRLTLEHLVAQADGPCRDINFDPTILPRGIEVSGDPLLAARSGAYARSHLLRTGEEARQLAAQGEVR